MSIPIRRTANPLFGKPTLASANNGIARWIRGSTSPLDQKSSTGWLAELYGGVQTGDDWARVSFPVDEMSLRDFRTADWSWYQTNTETMGVGIVLRLHNPDNFDARVEVTQLGGHADLPKATGWNAFHFTTSTAGMFFYGENTTGTNLTAGTQYTWAQFQADQLFQDWTIFNVSLEFGWEASGTFESAYVADVKFNGVAVPLLPSGGHRKTVQITKALAAASAYHAEDVLSESATNGVGTDWDFDFGGTGKIVDAMAVSATTAITPRLVAFLHRAPPTCELDDHAANTAPIAADLANVLPPIEFGAMRDYGTGMSFAPATQSTYGNLPIHFDTPIVYLVLATLDAFTQGAGANMTVILTAEMEDN